MAYGIPAVTMLPTQKPTDHAEAGTAARTTAQVGRRAIACSPGRVALPHVAGRATEIGFALAVSQSSQALCMTSAAHPDVHRPWSWAAQHLLSRRRVQPVLRLPRKGSGREAIPRFCQGRMANQPEDGGSMVISAAVPLPARRRIATSTWPTSHLVAGLQVGAG
jgi:hypothetical protein